MKKIEIATALLVARIERIAPETSAGFTGYESRRMAEWAADLAEDLLARCEPPSTPRDLSRYGMPAETPDFSPVKK